MTRYPASSSVSRTIVRTRTSSSTSRIVWSPPVLDGTASSSLAADEAAAPDVAAWKAQRQSVLNAALAGLPDAERQALRLAFFEELSHAEVADLLELPLGTVKTYIHRARHELRIALADEVKPPEAGSRTLPQEQ